ncbi:hypothetical protein KP509_01G072200 [Ceratopteris richardii]|uniref:Uncharacterized protein n=1 Tax=Ceratopteris richardii TaxID=49495 RepID=A0A8T2VE52_CERRI|nr:hypothetical protein KP509_01G072200 [Ceratopteris richardii]
MAWTSSCRRPLSRLIDANQTAIAPSKHNFTRKFAADHHHGPPKVKFWEDPMNPSKWKEEHYVLVSLAGWSLFGYGVYKGFSSLGNKVLEKEQAKV